MALVLKDRVKETTTTTGTGTLTLAGAAAGHQAFSVIGDANTTYYAIVDAGTGDWEVGLGTYTLSGTTLARTTVLASSNAGAAVNFAAGSKDVFVTYPAGKATTLDGTETLTNKTLDAETFSLAATVAGGTNAQGQGALTKDVNIITTTTANPSGVTLPATVAGRRVIVINRGTNPIKVFPAASSYIDSLAINVSTTIPVAGRMQFDAYDATHWQSSNGQVAAVISTLATGLLKVTTATGAITTATAGTDYQSPIGTISGMVKGNGANALTAATANTDYMPGVTPGTSGNVLTSNGSAWTSAASTSLLGVTDLFSPYETSLGYQAGNVVTGAGNTSIGYQAAVLLSTGTDNTVIGYQASNSLTTGYSNVTLGYQASYVTGGNTAYSISYQRVMVGYRAGYSTTGWSSNAGIGSTFMGYQAGYDNPSSYAVVIGNEAGFIGQCSNGVVIGAYAMRGALQYQSNIVVVGCNAGYNLNRADYTTCVGAYSLYTCSSGTYNTALGSSAGYAITTGAENTLLGANAGYNGVTNLTTGSNNTLIGYRATPTAAGVSNEFTLGNSSIATLRCQVTTITALSDRRDKTDIQTIEAGLDFVNRLKPVSFVWNMRDGGKVGEYDTGFIAQDLKSVQEETGVNVPGLVYESDPERLEAGYGKLLPILVKAIQDLSAEVAALKAAK